MGPLFPKEALHCPRALQTQCFCGKSKAERETQISRVKFGEVQKNEDPSLLTSLKTSCFSKPRLLLTSAKEYKAKLCWPGKLLHCGGSCGPVDLFIWGSCLQQTLRHFATALDSLGIQRH